jgi:hypothetical protein
MELLHSASPLLNTACKDNETHGNLRHNIFHSVSKSSLKHLIPGKKQNKMLRCWQQAPNPTTSCLAFISWTDLCDDEDFERASLPLNSYEELQKLSLKV